MADKVKHLEMNLNLITELEKLPDFGAMSDDEIVTWWECNEVSAKILTLLEDTGEEIGVDE